MKFVFPKLFSKRLINKSKTKSDTVWQDILNSDIIFMVKKYLSISMTSKIEIIQFYYWSQPKQWKWNKIRHISIHIFKSDVLSFLWKILKYLMTVKIEISQLYYKTESKHWRLNMIRHCSIRHIRITYSSNFSLAAKYQNNSMALWLASLSFIAKVSTNR